MRWLRAHQFLNSQGYSIKAISNSHVKHAIGCKGYDRCGYAGTGAAPAIADSHVGLAAYFLDHDAWSYALISRVFARESAGLTRDDVLDNITITWLTSTALSGAPLHWENKFSYFNVKGISIPVAVSAFPDEIDLCRECNRDLSTISRTFTELVHLTADPIVVDLQDQLARTTARSGVRFFAFHRFDRHVPEGVLHRSLVDASTPRELGSGDNPVRAGGGEAGRVVAL